MRIFEIVMFVFLFSLSTSLYKNLAITNVGVTVDSLNGVQTSTWIQREIDPAGNISGAPTAAGVNTQSTFSWLNAFYQTAVIGLPKIFMMFYDATIGLSATLQQVGVPKIIADPIWYATLFVYFIGILQIWLKINLREYS